jgi:hypothetical protein
MLFLPVSFTVTPKLARRASRVVHARADDPQTRADAKKYDAAAKGCAGPDRNCGGWPRHWPRLLRPRLPSGVWAAAATESPCACQCALGHSTIRHRLAVADGQASPSTNCVCAWRSAMRHHLPLIDAAHRARHGRAVHSLGSSAGRQQGVLLLCRPLLGTRRSELVWDGISAEAGLLGSPHPRAHAAPAVLRRLRLLPLRAVGPAPAEACHPAPRAGGVPTRASGAERVMVAAGAGWHGLGERHGARRVVARPAAPPSWLPTRVVGGGDLALSIGRQRAYLAGGGGAAAATAAAATTCGGFFRIVGSAEDSTEAP